MKNILKGKHFADVEEVEENMAGALQGTTINGFRNCPEQGKKRLDRCTASHREYCEGDRSLDIKNKYAIFYR